MKPKENKQLWPIEKLELWQRNPRKMTDEDKDRLKTQLLKLKQYKPLIMVLDAVSGIGTVLGGNMRLQAMRELVKEGHEQFAAVWVSIVDAPDEKTMLEYALSDNDRAGKYVEKELVEMVNMIDDFDLEMYQVDTGNAHSIADVVDWYKETNEDDFDADAEAKKIEVPTSKQGTVWQLGEHRLMCGSATSLDDLRVLMGGVKADMVFTDPPYNVDYKGKGKKTSNTILNDKLDPVQFEQFLSDSFTSYATAIKPDAAMYVCYASRSHREFENAIEKNGFKVKAQIIWVKTVAAMGFGDYRWKHEPIFYCSLEGKKVPFYGDRKQYTEWETHPTDAEILREAKRMLAEEKKDETTVWKLSREGGYVHPTQKPLELIEIALKNSSEKGEVILDLFWGSGSTLMASHQMGRRCFTMELDPKYVDVIVKRYREFTGEEPVLLVE